MNITKILVATDLSGPDRQCYAPAAALAKHLEVPLTVIHVDDVTAKQLDYTFPGMDTYFEHVASVRRVRIDQLLRDFAALGVEASFVLEHGQGADFGKPEDVIAAYAREHGFGLIVMAQHSTRGPLRKLLGSTTRRVMRLSDVPVLVVPVDDDKDLDEPPSALPSFERVLVPTDLGDHDLAALRAAEELTTKLGAELFGTHALDMPTFVPIPSGEAFLEAEGYLAMDPATHEALKRDAEERLAAHLNEALGHEVPHEVVWGTTVVEAVLTEAKRVGADMICVPSTGKGRLRRFFLGSVTESLVKRAPLPVLVMPPSFLAGWEG